MFSSIIQTLIIIAALTIGFCQLGCSDKPPIETQPAAKVASTQVNRDAKPVSFGVRVQKRRDTILDIYTREFAKLDPQAKWAVETTTLLKKHLAAYRVSRQNPFSVDVAECRGASLCKLVLSYPSLDKAREVSVDMRNNKVIKWPGHTKSFALHKNATFEVQKNKQLIFLTAKSHEMSLGDGKIIPLG